MYLTVICIYQFQSFTYNYPGIKMLHLFSFYVVFHCFGAAATHICHCLDLNRARVNQKQGTYSIWIIFVVLMNVVRRFLAQDSL